MLIDTTVHLPVSLAMLDGLFHPPSAGDLAHIIMRWLHFVAGITWIGLLYFFNLVNVPLQKKLDPDTKATVSAFRSDGSLLGTTPVTPFTGKSEIPGTSPATRIVP